MYIRAHDERGKSGRSMCKLTPLSSIDINNELKKISYIQPYSWSMDVAWTNLTSHIYSIIDAHKVSDSIRRDVSLRQPRKEDKALT